MGPKRFVVTLDVLFPGDTERGEARLPTLFKYAFYVASPEIALAEAGVRLRGAMGRVEIMDAHVEVGKPLVINQ